MQGIFLNYAAYTPQQIAAQFQELRRTGSTLGRSDSLWEIAEPSPPVLEAHTYHWQFDDLTVRTLAANGLRWFPIVDYAPLWARADPHYSPPGSSTNYASFAAALALRYGPHGTFWSDNPHLPAEPVDTYEIWNEPDTAEFWGPAPDAEHYADLYLHARAAIKAIDPRARVIIGGLAHASTFLPAMLSARPDLRGHVDGVAIHPYGPNPIAVLEGVQDARATITSLGMGTVPLYVTEFGWTTSPRGAFSYLPERVRPGFIATSVGALGHTNCGIAAVLIDTWVSAERNPSNSQEWFGIEPPAGGASPDADAFSSGVHAAQHPGSHLTLC